MSKSRILIVEDDIDIANMLKLYFDEEGYEVDLAYRRESVLNKTRQNMPHLILLDIMLPDIDGYEVCRTLRTNNRTRHIPVIFLTQKDERSDKLQGLELGADDYLTKPFDIEELKLRVKNAIQRAERDNLRDPRSGLPSARLIEEQLRQTIHQEKWALLDIRIRHFEAFNEVYGFVAGDDMLRFTAMLIGEAVDELGTSDDFIGHAGGDNFVIITTEEAATPIRTAIKNRFSNRVLTHYNFMDRDQGLLQVTDEDDKAQRIPLMYMAVGLVSPSQHPFSDIREIIEVAAEARRKDTA
ncbi:MAG: response regulator [Chloroflexota bacterium]